MMWYVLTAYCQWSSFIASNYYFLQIIELKYRSYTVLIFNKTICHVR